MIFFGRLKYLRAVYSRVIGFDLHELYSPPKRRPILFILSPLPTVMELFSFLQYHKTVPFWWIYTYRACVVTPYHGSKWSKRNDSSLTRKHFHHSFIVADYNRVHRAIPFIYAVTRTPIHRRRSSSFWLWLWVFVVPPILYSVYNGEKSIIKQSHYQWIYHVLRSMKTISEGGIVPPETGVRSFMNLLLHSHTETFYRVSQKKPPRTLIAPSIWSLLKFAYM